MEGYHVRVEEVVYYESRKRELKIRLMNEVPRQNKLEIPTDKDEVNKREIHECDGRTHDPGTMVNPLTPKPTLKSRHPRHGDVDHCLTS